MNEKPDSRFEPLIIVLFFFAIVYLTATPVAETAPANPDPSTLVWITPGTFVMGSPISETGRRECEGPQTEVTISAGFWISKHEVTQGEWVALMGENPSYNKLAGNSSNEMPVESVTWREANEYCRKLTERESKSGRVPTGWVYRLPSEAEWEYCCRAGTSSAFNYGEDPEWVRLGEHAWYAKNSRGGVPGIRYRGGFPLMSWPVCKKKPNAWGLYDMHGNVAEWCLDQFPSEFVRAPKPLPGGKVKDPLSQVPERDFDVVCRGGGYRDEPEYCRSASRSAHGPDTRNIAVGFRVVLAPRLPFGEAVHGGKEKPEKP
jgi:formylglycine-generating enzyme required for sulfatase activity